MHDTLSLGKHTEYPKSYAPEVLDAIPRAMSREALVRDWPDNTPQPPMHGHDVWHAYEVSWVNSRGKPLVGCVTLTIPCASEFIVESKSLKLYLNSLNQHVFTDAETLIQCIQRDVSNVVGHEVEVVLFDVEAAMRSVTIDVHSEWILLDALDIEVTHYQVTPDVLAAQGVEVTEGVYSHLLRSSCPVTDQPDWGSVFVYYQGAQIEHEALLKYIVSYRNNQEFHEQCVERMFMDIWQRCQPTQLIVAASYMRRGGIDINPIRTSSDSLSFNFPLISRQ
ncbi:MAG: NADPH-dependent 7-cyano-7-deazaguanine reductase QueF [Pseudomonadota bacterium]